MSAAIEPVGFLPPVVPLQESGAAFAPGAVSAGSPTFADWFTSQIGTVNSKVAASEANLQALAAGETENLHQVMISMEEARLSFQLLAQVRSRLLETYQDLMRMQI